MLALWRSARGVIRSLRIYYGRGRRQRATAMDRLHGVFVRPGDLVFDVGAHVGDRIASFRRLGARVVAIEPQPALIVTLRALYGRDRDVIIAPLAVGGDEGTLRLMVNSANPTISTASNAFIAASRDAPGWQGQTWDQAVDVRVTTLDALIAVHGMPAFIKIDVEGFEAEALGGLSHPVDALSFEFTTIQRDVAHRCLARCAAMGYSLFNAALGESQMLGTWRSRDEITQWLDALPNEANSGDIYARRA